MKIFFSTLFDSPSYPLNIFMENGIAVGAMHMGPTGLLHFLELHLGIPAGETSAIQRVFQYHQALQKNKEGSFYKKSFEANDLDSATRLLQWRDELKMAGWDFKTDKTTPKRLTDLAKIEEQIQPGFADRYRQVYHLVKSKQTIPLEEIVLHEPFDLLPPFYQQLFSIFKESGVTLKERNPQNPINQVNQGSDIGLLQDMVLYKRHPKTSNALHKDGSLQILQFGEQLSAANGVAALIEQDPSFRPVIINESADASLALALRERGIPYTARPYMPFRIPISSCGCNAGVVMEAVLAPATVGFFTVSI